MKNVLGCLLFMVATMCGGAQEERNAFLETIMGLAASALPEDARARETFCFEWARVAQNAGHTAMYDTLVRMGCLSIIMETQSASSIALLRHYEAFPNEVLTRNNLAWFKVSIEQSPVEALTLLQGVPMEALNGAIADTKAWIFYRLGRPADALQMILLALERSMQEKENHPLLFDHAGDIFYANHLYREAEYLWACAERTAMAVQKEQHLSDAELRAVCEFDTQKTHRKRAAVRRLHPSSFQAE